MSFFVVSIDRKHCMASSDISMYIAREAKVISLIEARRIISNHESMVRIDRQLINISFLFQNNVTQRKLARYAYAN